MAKFEDYTGHEREFKSEEIMEVYKIVDGMEEKIVDKYFDTDIEFETGLQLCKKMKGQLRRMDKDLATTIEIQKKGMPDED